MFYNMNTNMRFKQNVFKDAYLLCGAAFGFMIEPPAIVPGINNKILWERYYLRPAILIETVVKFWIVYIIQRKLQTIPRNSATIDIAVSEKKILFQTLKFVLKIKSETSWQVFRSYFLIQAVINKAIFFHQVDPKIRWAFRKTKACGITRNFY